MSGELTRDDVLAMPAGPEMDALILERVFGGFAVRSYDCKTGESFLWKLNRLGPSPAAYGDRPDYSTDIKAAWEVVNRLWQQGITMYVAVEVVGAYQNGNCLAKVSCSEGETSRAICQVALLAAADVPISLPAGPGSD